MTEPARGGDAPHTALAVEMRASVQDCRHVGDYTVWGWAERVEATEARVQALEADRDGARLVARQMQERLGAAQEQVQALEREVARLQGDAALRVGRGRQDDET